MVMPLLQTGVWAQVHPHTTTCVHSPVRSAADRPLAVQEFPHWEIYWSAHAPSAADQAILPDRLQSTMCSSGFCTEEVVGPPMPHPHALVGDSALFPVEQ